MTNKGINKVFALLCIGVMLAGCAHSKNTGLHNDSSALACDSIAICDDSASADSAAALSEEIKPKKVSILGDSYSTYQGWLTSPNFIAWYMPVPKEGRPTDVTKVDQTWWKIFIDENGYELETNNSFSGSTVCNTGYEKQDYSDRSFITRMKDLGHPDLILVFGGTNDDWAHVPLGKYVWSDWTPKELYSYRPAAAYMLSEMKKLYPDAEIVVMLNDILRPEIMESTKKICDHYDIKYLELKDIDKMSGHPDSKGMRKIADQLSELLSRQ